MSRSVSPYASIPSVDRLLRDPRAEALAASYGRERVRDALREESDALRRRISDSRTQSLPRGAAADPERYLLDRATESLATRVRPTLQAVFNLTGTVLHTNLGRAPLPVEAIEAMTVAAGAANVEMDLTTGKRGDRDDHVAEWLCRLTGAEAATAVNNNAAAVLLTLNSLASRRQVPVSRGELIEIGGAFRMPDIMARAGCRLVEVGTTNRTHLSDYADAIGRSTALLMKVHTSNYEVRGFTASVDEARLARLAHEHGIPCVSDLGSGSLVDFADLGLPPETTPRSMVEAGVDVVTFSGDKLLGGPQCGLIVGRRDLIAKIKRNPMKRALRLDKVTIAALAAVLRLYDNPETVVSRIPSLRQLARPVDAIRRQAQRLAPIVASHLEGQARVDVVSCESQVGSGALPLAGLPSAGLAVTPESGGDGRSLARLARRFRSLPTPVVGRVTDDALVLDLRTLEEEQAFVEQLGALGED